MARRRYAAGLLGRAIKQKISAALTDQPPLHHVVVLIQHKDDLLRLVDGLPPDARNYLALDAQLTFHPPLLDLGLLRGANFCALSLSKRLAVTDENIAALAGCEQLKSLQVESDYLTGSGLIACQQLQSLAIFGVALEPVILLRSLKAMPYLKQLSIAAIFDAAELAELGPDLQIICPARPSAAWVARP